MNPLIYLAGYAAALALALGVFWLWTEIADRMHARRMVKRFDLFVANMRARAGNDRSIDEFDS